MESKTDFTKRAIENMQIFRDRIKNSKYKWSGAYYEKIFTPIERALESGRQAMEELAEGRKKNQSGVALRAAVDTLRAHNGMYQLFDAKLNADASAAVHAHAADAENIDQTKHDLLGDASIVYSSMETALYDMKKHLPKRQRPMAVG